MRVDVVAIACRHGATLGQQVGRTLVHAKLLAKEDAVAVPQHRVNLIDILTVLNVLCEPVVVACDARSPPRVIRSIALQVLHDWMLQREAEALERSIVDGAHASDRPM